MKTLWVNTNFMHPTTKGGQIRTLEMLRHLHRWHEIHYPFSLDGHNAISIGYGHVHVLAPGRELPETPSPLNYQKVS